MSEDLTKIEETEVAAPAAKPKQFLILADELHMALLGKLIPGLLYVQVEGMNMEHNPNYMLLVNPVKKEPVFQPVQPEVA